MAGVVPWFHRIGYAQTKGGTPPDRNRRRGTESELAGGNCCRIASIPHSERVSGAHRLRASWHFILLSPRVVKNWHGIVLGCSTANGVSLRIPLHACIMPQAHTRENFTGENEHANDHGAE